MSFFTPTDSATVKRFLGTYAKFYRRHVQDLAAVAKSLTALTHKDKTTGGNVSFTWSSHCEEAFTKLKQRLVAAPVLQPPDLTRQFFVWTVQA